MKRTRLSDRMLPPYTWGEETMNMVTHIVGGSIGIFCLDRLPCKSPFTGQCCQHRCRCDLRCQHDSALYNIQCLSRSEALHRQKGAANSGSLRHLPADRRYVYAHIPGCHCTGLSRPWMGPYRISMDRGGAGCHTHCHRFEKV